MIPERTEAFVEAQRAAQTTLLQAEQVLPYNDGVITQTAKAGGDPQQPTYRLEVRLRYTDPDHLANAGTVTMTEQPPQQPHWTTLFIRHPHTFSYGKVSEPNGDTQTVFEVRQGEHIIFRCTAVPGTKTTEGRLGLGARRALARMTPIITTLTGRILQRYPDDQPTQPL